MTTIDFTTDIRYDRTTKDYAVTVNGKLIGYASNYGEGEEMANAYRYKQIKAEQAQAA